jgi:ribonuclease Z
MKPAFIHRLVNGPFEDPSLFVGIPWERRALLFDIGDISKLGPGNLQKITDVFVTHTHIDHFIGFDILLRAVLRREVPLRIYGPANITECIEGKLKGYTWNLIKDYPLKLEVICVDGNSVARPVFMQSNAFRERLIPHRLSTAYFLKNLLLQSRPSNWTIRRPV